MHDSCSSPHSCNLSVKTLMRWVKLECVWIYDITVNLLDVIMVLWSLFFHNVLIIHLHNEIVIDKNTRPLRFAPKFQRSEMTGTQRKQGWPWTDAWPWMLQLSHEYWEAVGDWGRNFCYSQNFRVHFKFCRGGEKEQEWQTND